MWIVVCNFLLPMNSVVEETPMACVTTTFGVLSANKNPDPSWTRDYFWELFVTSVFTIKYLACVSRGAEICWSLLSCACHYYPS